MYTTRSAFSVWPNLFVSARLLWQNLFVFAKSGLLALLKMSWRLRRPLPWNVDIILHHLTSDFLSDYLLNRLWLISIDLRFTGFTFVEVDHLGLWLKFVAKLMTRRVLIRISSFVAFKSRLIFGSTTVVRCTFMPIVSPNISLIIPRLRSNWHSKWQAIIFLLKVNLDLVCLVKIAGLLFSLKLTAIKIVTIRLLFRPMFKAQMVHISAAHLSTFIILILNRFGHNLRLHLPRLPSDSLPKGLNHLISRSIAQSNHSLILPSWSLLSRLHNWRQV